MATPAPTIAQNTANTGPNGFKRQLAAQSPRSKERQERVIPQPGQGNPNTCMEGQGITSQPYRVSAK